MPSQLDIAERGERLVVTVSGPPAARIVLAALAAGAITTFAAYRQLGFEWAVFFTAASVAAAVAAWFTQQSKAVLRIDLDELQLQGRSLDRTVSTDVIRWLEYQGAPSGPKNPEGLHAIVGDDAVCILPGVNAAQADLVLKHIAEKFPELAAQWAAQSPAGPLYQPTWRPQ